MRHSRPCSTRVAALLAQHAGPGARDRARTAKEQIDPELERRALKTAGFADVARAEGTGPLEAALVTEAVARAGGRGCDRRARAGGAGAARLGRPRARSHSPTRRTTGGRCASARTRAALLVLDAGRGAPGSARARRRRVRCRRASWLSRWAASPRGCCAAGGRSAPAPAPACATGGAWRWPARDARLR